MFPETCFEHSVGDCRAKYKKNNFNTGPKAVCSPPNLYLMIFKVKLFLKKFTGYLNEILYLCLYYCPLCHTICYSILFFNK